MEIVTNSEAVSVALFGFVIATTPTSLVKFGAILKTPTTSFLPEFIYSLQNQNVLLSAGSSASLL